MIQRLLIGLAFCCIPFFVSAQPSDDFTIRVFGAIDTEAPSTTTIQSLVPISSSQIDIGWATSTDNFTVFGYVLSRDGVPIATTTATFYIDTSLAASTTYSYTVRTFDGVPNYSSSSVPATTTTLAIPVVPPVGTDSTVSGTIARVVLESFSLETGAATATIKVVTRQRARIEIRFGETQTYEIGYIAGTNHKTVHTIPVNNLRPDTRYYYEVLGYTPSGKQTVLRRESFVTLDDAPPSAPANVQNFTATVSANDVLLSWTLPNSMPTTGLVRIVQSQYGYPVFINDGIVVYEGRATKVTDTAALARHDRVFYTAFVIDMEGLVSSGAIAQVSATREGATVTPSGVLLPEVPSFDQASTAPGFIVPTKEIISIDMPQPSDIVVTQADEVYTFELDSIALASDDTFTVSIQSEVIIGDFKTIIVTLTDPRGSGNTFSFLLRLNADRTAYEATIAAVQVAGLSDLMVEIYDYNAQVVGRYLTEVTFIPGAYSISSTTEALSWRLAAFFWSGVMVVPLLVLFVLWFIFKRREADEDKNSG